jgi:hypothetical protein
MRTNKIFLVVGNRGTGKTTFLQGNSAVKVPGIIPTYQRRKPGQKVLILYNMDNPVWQQYPIISPEQVSRWKSGICRYIFSDINEAAEQLKNLKDTVLIFEDATSYIEHKLAGPFKSLLLDSKQNNNDIFLVFHFLMAVPRDISRIADYLVVFKTNEVFDTKLINKFPNPLIKQKYEALKKVNNPYAYEALNIN